MDRDREEELLIKSKSDFSAFADLYTNYQPKIYAYILNRVLSREVAEDITGKVFLESLNFVMHKQLSEGASFGSWLYKVAHNKVIDYYRSRDRSVVCIDSLSNLESTDKTPDAKVEISELQIHVSTVLREIKPRYQEIISLKFYSELNNQEISDVMGIQHKHVSVLLHRALKAFKKRYMKKYPESEIF